MLALGRTELLERAATVLAEAGEVDVGVVLEVIEKAGHIPVPEDVSAPLSCGRTYLGRAAFDLGHGDFHHGECVAALLHDDPLSPDDAHPFVGPGEGDLFVGPGGFVESLFEWMAADAVEDRRQEPGEVELSG